MKVAVTGGTGSWDRGIGPVVIAALQAKAAQRIAETVDTRNELPVCPCARVVDDRGAFAVPLRDIAQHCADVHFTSH